MKCPECKTENNKNAKFCESCGKNLPKNNFCFKNIVFKILNMLKNIGKLIAGFLSRDNIVLILLFVACISIYKIAFYGIEINGSIDTETSIGDSVSIDGRVDTDTSVSGDMDVY